MLFKSYVLLINEASLILLKIKRMRRKRYLLFPLFLFLFCLPFCAEAQVGEKKLTVEFKNEELSSVFKQLSKISGYKNPFYV